jgi:hypothetical protein
MNRFKKILIDNISSLNYTLLPYNVRANDVIFYKELSSGIILTLGIYHSNLYQKRFTGAYYMALSYTWAMCTPIFLPGNAYQHIGSLLSLSDKKKLLDKEYWNTSNNAWWNTSEEDILNFINSIHKTEDIFLNDEQEVLSKISNPLEYQRYKIYMSILNEILNIISGYEISSLNENVFCEITQSVLKKRKDKMNNKYGIKLVVTDAMNCYYLSSPKNRCLIKKIADIANIYTS